MFCMVLSFRLLLSSPCCILFLRCCLSLQVCSRKWNRCIKNTHQTFKCSNRATSVWDMRSKHSDFCCKLQLALQIVKLTLWIPCMGSPTAQSICRALGLQQWPATSVFDKKKGRPQFHPAASMLALQAQDLNTQGSTTGLYRWVGFRWRFWGPWQNGTTHSLPAQKEAPKNIPK